MYLGRNSAQTSIASELNIFTYASRVSYNSIGRGRTRNGYVSPEHKVYTPLDIATKNKTQNNSLNLIEDFPALPVSSKTDVEAHYKFQSPSSTAHKKQVAEHINEKNCWRDILVSSKDEECNLLTSSTNKTKSSVKSDNSNHDVTQKSPRRNSSKLFESRHNRSAVRKDVQLPSSIWNDVPACPVFNESIWSDLPSNSGSSLQSSVWNHTIAKPKLRNNELSNNYSKNRPQKTHEKSVSFRDVRDFSDSRHGPDKGTVKTKSKSDNTKFSFGDAQKNFRNRKMEIVCSLVESNKFIDTFNEKESCGEVERIICSKNSDKNQNNRECISGRRQQDDENKVWENSDNNRKIYTKDRSSRTSGNTFDTRAKTRSTTSGKFNGSVDFTSKQKDNHSKDSSSYKTFSFKTVSTEAKENKQTNETSADVQKKKKKKRPSKIKRQAAMYSGKVVVIPAEVSAKLANAVNSEDEQKFIVKESVDFSSTSEFPELAATNFSKKRIDIKECLKSEIKVEAIVQELSECHQENIEREKAKQTSEGLKIKVLTGSNPKGSYVKVDADIFADSQEQDKQFNSASSPIKTLVKENSKVKICPRDPISLADLFLTSAPKQKEKKKKPEVDSKIVTKKSTANHVINVLDSSGPVVKRGKEREKPKTKKTTHLKKIILKEREQKKEKLKNLVKAAEQYLKTKPNINNADSITEPYNRKGTKIMFATISNSHSTEDGSEKHANDKPFLMDSSFKFGSNSIEEILGKHMENQVPLLQWNKDNNDSIEVSHNQIDLIPNNLNTSESKDQDLNCSSSQDEEYVVTLNENEKNRMEKPLKQISEIMSDIKLEKSLVPESHSEIIKSSLSPKNSFEYNEGEDFSLSSDPKSLCSFVESEKHLYTDSINLIEQGDIQVDAAAVENALDDHSSNERQAKGSLILKGDDIWKEITSSACEVCKDVFLKLSVNSAPFVRNSDSVQSDETVDVGSADGLTEENRRKAIKLVIHTKSFREYCDHLLSKKLDENVQQLLEDLARFQDRMHQKDPVKAHMKRRLVYGIKEVTKKCKLKKLKCVIIAPNVENIQSEGGLNDALGNLIKFAGEYHVPCIFALERKLLGKLCKKPVPVSCVGVFNYEGSEVSFKNILELHEESVKDYKELYTIIQNNIRDEDVMNLLRANESAPGTLLGCRMKVLRSTLMKRKDSNSKHEVSPECEKFVDKYMIKM